MLHIAAALAAVGACNDGSAAAEEIVRGLNQRFADGSPSSKLHLAGVVMRGHDGAMLTAGKRAQHSNLHWITHEATVSASLVNARVPYLFAGNQVMRGLPDGMLMGHCGVVISPAIAHKALLCSYPRDAASVYVKCIDGVKPPPSDPDIKCVPGCVGVRLLPRATPETLRWTTWCDIASNATGAASPHVRSSASYQTTCAWKPEALATTLELQESLVAHEKCTLKRPCCTHPDCLSKSKSSKAPER